MPKFNPANPASQIPRDSVPHKKCGIADPMGLATTVIMIAILRLEIMIAIVFSAGDQDWISNHILGDQDRRSGLDHFSMIGINNNFDLGDREHDQD